MASNVCCTWQRFSSVLSFSSLCHQCGKMLYSPLWALPQDFYVIHICHGHCSSWYSGLPEAAKRDDEFAALNCSCLRVSSIAEWWIEDSLQNSKAVCRFGIHVHAQTLAICSSGLIFSLSRSMHSTLKIGTILSVPKSSSMCMFEIL